MEATATAASPRPQHRGRRMGRPPGHGDQRRRLSAPRRLGLGGQARWSVPRRPASWRREVAVSPSRSHVRDSRSTGQGETMSDGTIDNDALDFFRGSETVADPYPYFDWLREQCPVHREPQHGVYMVTGYEEAFAVYADPDTF